MEHNANTKEIVSSSSKENEVDRVGSKTPENQHSAKLTSKMQQVQATGILKGPKSTLSDRASVKSNHSVDFVEAAKEMSNEKL